MAQALYVFTWTNMNNPEEPYGVYTYNLEDLKLFLSQHGFNTENNSNVEVTYDTEGIDDADRDYVRIYTVGSRKRDQLYRIATTETIVSSVIMEIGSELSEAMTFGACALRGEIEIFKRITDLISELDYVYVKDGIVADTTDDDYEKYHVNNGYPYYEDIAKNADDSFLYDELYSDAVPQKQVQPFTIETYVNIFTDIYIIGRKMKQHGVKTPNVNG